MGKKSTEDLKKVINYLSEVNRHIGKTLFILGFDDTKSEYLIVQDRYGLLSVAKRNLKDGCMPTITSAIIKKDYFENLLYERNKNFREGKFIVKSFIGDRVLVETKYGECLPSSKDLLKGCLPTIMSAVDKTEFFKNKLLYSNEYYKSGDFTIVSEYIGRGGGDMTIFSKKYGYLQVRSDTLLRNYNPSCVSNKPSTANKNKRQLYVVELFNLDEQFYKIGVSDNVFNRIKNYPSEYNKKIVYLLENKDIYYPTKCYDMEQKILGEFEHNYKYTPKIKFDGDSECLTINPINYIYNY